MLCPVRILASTMRIATALGSLLVFSSALADERPNIVLIMADDVSWEAFGCYGAGDYQTPHLDELAAQGVRMTHCYSTPICTTSRVQIMTGKYNFRNYTHFGYLNPAEKTFAHLLKDAGYKTAIAGKWQLNGLTNKLPGYDSADRPYDAGFDEYMLWQLRYGKQLSTGGGERFWSPPLEHNGRLVTRDENAGKYGPDLLCDFLCDFADRSGDQPFFLYYPMVLVHNPFVPTPDTIGDRSRSHDTNKQKKGKAIAKENFVAMVQYMDKIVGRIVQHLEQTGELDNTLVLFTADNGTNTAITSRWNGREIRGGKAGMKDMGTHVPLIAFWKGRTLRGAELGELVDFTDFYPTLADAAGVTLDASDPSDGRSFLPHIQGKPGVTRKMVFCHYEPYWNKAPGQFVRTQDYKMYRDGRFYMVPVDLDEKQNLAESSDLTEVQRAVRGELSTAIGAAPPAPVGKGNKDTKLRPLYPGWSLPPLLNDGR
ncbi:MAG: sulfatase-like hydrolase/transferase [Aureliella sp.]